LEEAIGWRKRAGDHDARVDSVEHRRNIYVVSFSWADREGKRHTWAHRITTRGSKIIDIQDHASARRATASMRLRTLFA
jgi:hypothetical protein